MKKAILILIAVFGALSAYSQQERQYTQFMYNKLSFNPGYAGSYDAACLTGIYRNQWMGLEGAPTSISLSFDMPLNGDKVGIGLNLHSNKIGITNTLWADGAYAYRIPVGKGTVGIGVQASIRYFSNNYADDRLVGTQDLTGDQSIPDGRQSKYLPNFGAGIYYSTEKFYFGFSAPRMLKNDIDFSTNNPKEGIEVQHLYGMTGILLPIANNIQLQPQLLVKFASNSPIDADLNLNLIFSKKFTVGASYRFGGDDDSVGESIDFLASAYIRDNIMFGLAYDVTLSGLKDYNNGSLEAVVRYCFKKSIDEEIINPRFF